MYKAISLFLFCTLFSFTNAQSSIQNIGRYRITFADKKNSTYSIEKPSEFLSPFSIAQKQKYGIAITEEDIPVNQQYIHAVSALGAKHLNSSKWFNSAVFEFDSTSNPTEIKKLPFIVSIEWVAPLQKLKLDNSKIQNESPIDTRLLCSQKKKYGESFFQIKQLRALQLHADGYTGKNIRIAVIDGGFYMVNTINAFDSLRLQERILATKDCSGKSIDIFSKGSSHGLYVLSILAANIPGKIIGSAPHASYVLLRSEETASEYRVEEDNWVSAAEFADSIGVHIISTSLGYNLFDDSKQNYDFSDLNSGRIRISKAAEIASKKGILVIKSAGNSGAKPWKYITAPGDNPYVLTVGACYANKEATPFSSRGFSDSLVKPNMLALGYNTTVIGANGKVSQGNGTSFACPLLAGIMACLWQEFPSLHPQDLIRLVEKSCSQYSKPNSENGYGVPDIEKARKIIRKYLFQNDTIRKY